MTGSIAEIWLAPRAGAPMQRMPAARLLPGVGLEGDRYALGGGTWARYPALEKQLTLIDCEDVAAVAADVGARLSAGDTRRNLVTVDVDLPALVGRWFTIGDAVLLGVKRCPPCSHLERLTGIRLIKAMVHRGGINAAVFRGASIAAGDPIEVLTEEEAVRRGAPAGPDRAVPRIG